MSSAFRTRAETVWFLSNTSKAPIFGVVAVNVWTRPRVSVTGRSVALMWLVVHDGSMVSA